MNWQLTLLIRLLVAVVYGFLIGYNRDRHGHPGGIRTHVLVSLSSALFILIILFALGPQPDMNVVSRGIQGVATGIGFLGAGEIFRNPDPENGKPPVRGLTTAAATWFTAALGVSAALGAWLLGGIACVDLLLENDPPKVDLLVTVGSQAPLLYEWNALVNQKFEKDFKLPDSFPHWLNIYDERDFLSYLAADIFVSKKKVEDVPVESGQPFPESHGAYWGNKAVWQAIFDRMPKS
jgi:hypothetical protein